MLPKRKNGRRQQKAHASACSHWQGKIASPSLSWCPVQHGSNSWHRLILPHLEDAPTVSTLYPAHHRATKALARVGFPKYIDRASFVIQYVACPRWRHRHPFAPQFSSSPPFDPIEPRAQAVCRTPIRIRTGKRRSTSAIRNPELAAIAGKPPGRKVLRTISHDASTPLTREWTVC